MAARITSGGKLLLRNGKLALTGIASAIAGTLTGDIAYAGDSLIDLGYGICSARLGAALSLCPPRAVFNGGVAGNTIKDLADRFSAMLAAFPSAATWVIRIGTNGPGTSTYQTEFGRLFTMLAAAGKVGVFHAIPPKNTTAGVDSPFIAENAWLKAQCDANPAGLRFIDDSAGIGDANYVVLSGYTSDGIHMNGKGVYVQAKAMAPRYAAIFAPVDPRILDATDKYVSNAASDQWVQNPLMAGTGGTKGSGITGTVADNWDVAGYGAGTGGVALIVAADAGDPVQVPWLRVANVTSGGSGHELDFTTVLAHPAVAADSTIKRLDIVAEMRFNALNMNPVSGLLMDVYVGGSNVGPSNNIPFDGGIGTITERMVLRASLPRTQQASAGNAATLSAYGANTMRLMLRLGFNAAQATPMGSIDIRCVSVRGQAT